MKRNEFKTRAASFAIGFAMLIGLGLMMNTTAQAQYRQDDYRHDRDNWNRRGRWDDRRTKEYAYAFAYYVAYPEARETAYRRHGVDYDNVSGYRNDTTGYLYWMGDRNDYRSYYRKGFEQGWKDGQNGRSQRIERRDVERLLGDSLRNVYGHNWDRRNDNYRDNDRYSRYNRDQIIRIAEQNGYRSGYRHGEDDRNRRRGYDYDDSSDYRNALDGYRSEYGDRDFYRSAYRDGYKRGYDEGYRRNSGWGNRGNNRNWPF